MVTMINWEDYNYNQEVCIQILNNGEIDNVTVKLLEYGWHEHGRIKITAIVEILNSSDEKKWHIGAKMELPIKTDGEISFIMLEHTNYVPRHKTIHKGEIIAFDNNDI
jgi:hypothetical protein